MPRKLSSIFHGNYCHYFFIKTLTVTTFVFDSLTNREYICCLMPAKVKQCQPRMESDNLSSCQFLLSHLSQKLFIWMIYAMATIGNVLVIVQNRSIRKEKKYYVPIFLINNLAVSDFIMSIYLAIILIADLNYNTGQYSFQSEFWLSSPYCLLAYFFGYLF